MKTKTIQIDTSFPGLRDGELEKLLSNGWKILDKTITKDRYIYYVLSKEEHDPYYGRDSTTHP